MARCQTQTDTKLIAICSEILPSLCTYLYTPTHVCSAAIELFLQSLAKELLCVMQQNQLFSVLQLNGFLFPGGAGKGAPWRETGHLGGPIQNRYRTDMKVELAVQIAAKPIQEKTSRREVGPAAISKVNRKCS